MPLIPVPIWRGGGQNVLEIFELATRHNGRTTRTDDTNGIREFSVDGFIFTYVQKYISGPLTKGGRPHRPPAMDPPLSESECCMLSDKIFPRPHTTDPHLQFWLNLNGEKE